MSKSDSVKIKSVSILKVCQNQKCVKIKRVSKSKLCQNKKGVKIKVVSKVISVPKSSVPKLNIKVKTIK